MIISRTPFRISFFGGGTDYPAWYEKHVGRVINATINKYCFITVRYLPPFFKYKHRVRYYLHEEAQTLDEIKHPSVRESAKYLKINKGIEIVHNADLPAQSGLGSSSTFTVGLLNALYAMKNYMPTKRELALDAIHVEQSLIMENVGSQDQTAAAFGGLNRITFNGGKDIEVEPIIISDKRRNALQENLMLFFTGFARTASDIAKTQIEITSKKEQELNRMMEICDEGLKRLTDSKESLDKFGELLNEQWKLKRDLTNKISNEDIDDIYNKGINAGALGGKLLGAGGGGFMLFYVPKKNQEKVKNALSAKLFVPIRFEYTGSKIIYYSHNDSED
ncbi:MAG: kinase [Candidatus Marinimicrobia bacterium]|nr:kinase [Candidatus Neomarinimicrobiota bacterium]|tara:strand:+ start:94023 stop:95024 length:1002 start_codon:yes stop_codon:yes gene_type:complete